MSILNNSLLLGQEGSNQYRIQRSLRFNSSDSAYLSRTPSSAGNRKTWTWSGWVKRSALGSADQMILSTGTTPSATTAAAIFFRNDALCYSSGTIDILATSALYRDPSAWYHFVIAFDSTQATASSRLRIFANGTEITQFSTDNRASAITQNTDYAFNQTLAHEIGRFTYDSVRYFSGYLAEFHFIDGQALTPSSFAETNATTGQWVPKAFSGSYGTNGFKLDFADNSAATAAALGKDTSGNGNNWTPNNLSVTAGSGNDSLVDTPTSYGTDTGVGGEVRGNYATLNPLDVGTGQTFSNGNLEVSITGSGSNTYGTMAVSSGKWYWEVRSGGVQGEQIGIADANATSRNSFTANGWCYEAFQGRKVNNSNYTSYGASYANGDIIGVALNMDAGEVTFYKNGVSQGVAFNTGLSGKTIQPMLERGSGLAMSWICNFGQRPFAYTAPSGFKCLADTSLPTPVVAKPSTVFDATLYTGNGSSQTISGIGFSPDLVWIKKRSGTSGHLLQNSVTGTGTGKALYTNTTGAEGSADAYGYLSAITSDGFTTQGGTDPSDPYDLVGANNQTYVSWLWDAGSSTVTNTQGSITSSVRANASAGFSIVTYTVSAPNQTVGHGLGVAPAMSIAKRRNSSGGDWYARFKGGSFDGYLLLNSTAAGTTAANSFTSTTVPCAYLSTSNEDWVLYNFAPVAGYSSFGSYTGNGSADGPFVFCNFRPRWILIKSTAVIDGGGQWYLQDTARSTYNGETNKLYPNTSGAENSLVGEGATTNLVDFLSNGFKLRSANLNTNQSSTSYIYCAFAESPFQYARAR